MAWKGNGRILDIGGGSGMVSMFLDSTPNTECICVDISHNMLSHAVVPSVQADALKLPFEDDSFDLLVAAAFFHHLPGMESLLLAECYRVLVPGGRLLGYDPNAKCIQNRLFMTGGPLRLTVFSPDERPIVPDALRKQAINAGFRKVDSYTFSFRNNKLTPFEFVQRYILNPLAKGPLKQLLDRWFFWDATK